MKIVFVIDHFDSSNNGTSVTARRLAEQLEGKGHSVKILCADSEDKYGEKISAFRVPFFQNLIEQQGFRLAKVPDVSVYEDAFKGADLIHLYVPSLFCRKGAMVAQDMGIPCISAFHVMPQNVTYTLGLGTNKTANEFLYQLFYRSFYKNFDYIHCPTQMTANQLKQHGYKAELRVISNGVDQKFTAIETRKPPELEDKYILLMVGRLSGEKRQDLLVEAVKQSKYHDKLQIIFAGNGPRKKELQKLCKNLKNPPIFGFYTQDELLRLYNSCDLYIHAADVEVEGLSCMEAIACGAVPVISDSELSATHFFALHPRNIFRAGEAGSLAEQIDYWIEHPEEKASLSLDYVKKGSKMHVDNYAAAMEDLYLDAIYSYFPSADRARQYARK